MKTIPKKPGAYRVTNAVGWKIMLVGLSLGLKAPTALQAEPHGGFRITVEAGPQGIKSQVAQFIASTERELLIYTPYARGLDIMKPLVELRQNQGSQVAIAVLVEGPKAIANQTHTAMERLLIPTFAIPLDAKGLRPFTVSSTFLVRDGKEVLTMSQPLDLAQIDELNMDPLMRIQHEETAEKFRRIFLKAASHAEAFPTANTTDRDRIIQPRSIQEKLELSR